MTAATREWVRCAEEDFDVSAALMRRRTKTAANSIGFHCQQCVEKYLKAVLAARGIVFPKTHDLIELDALLPDPCKLPAVAQNRLKMLNPFADRKSVV